MGFVANFICFPLVKNVGNPLRFDKVTESLNVTVKLNAAGNEQRIIQQQSNNTHHQHQSDRNVPVKTAI